MLGRFSIIGGRVLKYNTMSVWVHAIVRPSLNKPPGHWCRLFRNIWWVNQNIGEKKVIKVINASAFLNYWGHVQGLPPKSTPMPRVSTLYMDFWPRVWGGGKILWTKFSNDLFRKKFPF